MQHIGFIMDGNRRWAKKLGNIALFGHERGGENVERVLEMCLKRDIPYVSMWALSKENIVERSTVEVEGIFTLFRKKIPTLIPKLIHHSIRLEYIGNQSLLPDDIVRILDDAEHKTKQGTAMTFILGIAYSGQDEIIRGVKRYIAQGKDLSTLDERSFLQSLDSGVYPPPDLIVRTGGHTRHSGYFLYQSSYSEYFFTDTLWPDFGEGDLERAITSFESTERKFGK